MSALGHKRTFRDFGPMSALPPKADIAERDCHVRFVLKADLCLNLRNANKADGPDPPFGHVAYLIACHCRKIVA
jgi:hypothetical protein